MLGFKFAHHQIFQDLFLRLLKFSILFFLRGRYLLILPFWLERCASVVIVASSINKRSRERRLEVVLTPSADDFSLHAVCYPDHFERRGLVGIFLCIYLDIKWVRFGSFILGVELAVVVIWPSLHLLT